MAGSTEKTISRLMSEALVLYGLGHAEQAMRCWREVLLLDPDHAEAREFLSTAGEEEPAVPATSPDHEGLFEEALQLLREGDAERAYDLFETVAEQQPERLDLQSYIEMARSQLFKSYQERFSDGRAIPRLCVELEGVLDYDLPVHAGFVLSMIDGVTRVEDLLSLSGMDPFETLRILQRLADAGILEAGS